MTKMRADSGHPLLLEDVLVRHPKLRLYVMHAGWPFLDEMKALLYEHPQVYVDVGVIGWSQPRPEFDRFLRGLVEAGYARRIMFGSDQMVWPDRIERPSRVRALWRLDLSGSAQRPSRQALWALRSPRRHFPFDRLVAPGHGTTALPRGPGEFSGSWTMARPSRTALCGPTASQVSASGGGP